MEAGRSALARGAWLDAKSAFEGALAQKESPEALEGLGLSSWWLDHGDSVFDTRERAYALYRERGEHASAARLAVWLAWDYAAFRGETAVASGWLQRARRLLEGEPEGPEHRPESARPDCPSGSPHAWSEDSRRINWQPTTHNERRWSELRGSSIQEPASQSIVPNPLPRHPVRTHRLTFSGVLPPLSIALCQGGESISHRIPSEASCSRRQLSPRE